MAARGDPRGYYRELGIHRTATAEEIRVAFRERAKLVHPDQAGDGADDGRFKQLAEAYEMLKDPRRRLQYDAEGLSAEREQGRHGVAEPAPPRWAGRPAWAGATGDISGSGSLPRWLLPTAGGLAAIAAAALVSLVWAWGEIGRQDDLLADLGNRYEATAARLADIATRYRASSVGASSAAGGRAIYRGEIAFHQDATDLDAAARGELDQTVVALAQALRTVPENADWVILLDAFAGRAADGEGVKVADWEASLLRLGHVVDWLVGQGLPAERLAARFQAGLAPIDVAAASPTVEVKLVCCFK
jgi:curved DNA-binding protein CbpA